MKKFLVFVLTLVTVLSLFSTTVLADAIVDWNDETSVDYYVEVSAPDGYVNVRTGPGTDYDIIDESYNGEVFHVIAESTSGNWAQIEYDHGFAWIALSQVTRTSAPSSSSNKSTTLYRGGSACNYEVVVAAPDGGVNLRFGPGTDYDIRISMIPNNIVLTVTAEKGGWGMTYYKGTDGWIALSQVTEYVPLEIEEEQVVPTPAAPTATPTQTPAATPTQEAAMVPTPAASQNTNTHQSEDEVLLALQQQQQQNAIPDAKTSMGFGAKLLLIGVIVFVVILAAVIVLCIWMKKTKNTEFFEEYDGYGAQGYAPDYADDGQYYQDGQGEYEGEYSDEYAEEYTQEYAEQYTEEYAQAPAEEVAEEPVAEVAEETAAEEPAQSEAEEVAAEETVEETVEEPAQPAEEPAREVADESATKAAVKDKDIKADAKDLKKKF